MAYVFISYFHEDKDYVDELKTFLENAGHEVWVDRHNLEPGDWWESEIQKAIYKCDSILVVLSPDALKSEYVIMEFTLAIKLKKLLIPLLYKSTNLEENILRKIQYEDVQNRQMPQRALNRLNRDFKLAQTPINPEIIQEVFTPSAINYAVERFDFSEFLDALPTSITQQLGFAPSLHDSASKFLRYIEDMPPEVFEKLPESERGFILSMKQTLNRDYGFSRFRSQLRQMARQPNFVRDYPELADLFIMLERLDPPYVRTDQINQIYAALRNAKNILKFETDETNDEDSSEE